MQKSPWTTFKFAYLLHTTKCTPDPIKWEMSLLNAYASGNKRLLSICNFKLSLPIFSNVLSISMLNGRSQWNKEHVGKNTMPLQDMHSLSLDDAFPPYTQKKKLYNALFPRKVRVLRMELSLKAIPMYLNNKSRTIAFPRRPRFPAVNCCLEVHNSH